MTPLVLDAIETGRENGDVLYPIKEFRQHILDRYANHRLVPLAIFGCEYYFCYVVFYIIIGSNDIRHVFFLFSGVPSGLCVILF